MYARLFRLSRFSYEKECKKDWEYHETCMNSVPSLWTTRYFILLQNVRYSKRPKSRWVHNVLSIFWSTENCILDHLQSISATMVLKLQWCAVKKWWHFRLYGFQFRTNSIISFSQPVPVRTPMYSFKPAFQVTLQILSPSWKISNSQGW